MQVRWTPVRRAAAAPARHRGRRALRTSAAAGASAAAVRSAWAVARQMVTTTGVSCSARSATRHRHRHTAANTAVTVTAAGPPGQQTAAAQCRLTAEVTGRHGPLGVRQPILTRPAQPRASSALPIARPPAPPRRRDHVVFARRRGYMAALRGRRSLTAPAPRTRRRWGETDTERRNRMDRDSRESAAAALLSAASIPSRGNGASFCRRPRERSAVILRVREDIGHPPGGGQRVINGTAASRCRILNTSAKRATRRYRTR